MQKEILQAQMEVGDPLLYSVDSASSVSRCHDSHLAYSTDARRRVRTRSPRSSWVQQRDLIVDLQPFNGSAALVFAEDFDFALFETFAALEIDDALTIFHEQRLAGDIEHVFLLVAGDYDSGCKTGTQAQVFVQKLDGNIKFPAHVPLPELSRGHAAYGSDRAGDNLAQERIKLDLGRLANFDVVTLTFADPGGHFHLTGIDYLRNGASRPHLVPGPIVRHRHPLPHLIHAGVFFNGHQTVHGCGDEHLLDVLLRLIHSQLRLVLLLLGQPDRGPPGGDV